MIPFEALAGVSIAIAIGTLTLVSVVLKPRYEERFKAYKERNRSDLLNKFETVFTKLKASVSDTLPDETYEAMDELIDYWREYGSVETSLESYLLRQRNIVVAWMGLTIMSVLSVQYDSQLISNTAWGPLTLGALTLWLFLAVAAYTAKFYWDLLTLDVKFTKISSSEKVSQPASGFRTERNEVVIQ